VKGVRLILMTSVLIDLIFIFFSSYILLIYLKHRAQINPAKQVTSLSAIPEEKPSKDSWRHWPL